MIYMAPASVGELLRAHRDASGQVSILAGGTDLLVQMKNDFTRPDVILDVKRIAELDRIVMNDDGFEIGAAVSCFRICEHTGLGNAWPGLIEAASLIGSTQIQGRATLIGNLCNASPAADTIPALIAADATISIAGPDGAREMRAEDFVTGPGTSALGDGEVVLSVKLPPRPDRSGDAYERFIPRTEMDIAVVGVGVSLEVDDDGICSAARVGLGAVAPTALHVEAAGQALVGSKLDDAALKACSDAAMAACRPIDDKRGTKTFRIRVAAALARRVALAAYRRAGGEA